MVKITYTEHLKLRLKIRKIPEKYPREIYINAEQKYFDDVEGRYIAIKKLHYADRLRNMMIAYEKKDKDKEIEIITIHPIKDEQIIKRIMSRRWKENE